MKNNRLFGIIYMLLTKDTITAKWLAENFEVSVRTIYRDIELLSSLNIPIYMNKGKNGGISLLEDYKLDKTLLTDEEQNQILFALQSLKKLSGDTNDVFDKIKTIFNKDNKNWIDIDFSIWGKKVIKNTVFDNIKQSIVEAKKIEFDYYNSYGEINHRKVEPLQICFKYNTWYLNAYDEIKQDYRLFKLTRMKNIKILEEEVIKDIPIKESDNIDYQNTILFVLEIDKKMAYRVYDEFDEQSFTLMKNGDFLVKLEYPKSEWVYGYILSFGEYAKVISPVSLKNDIKKRLEKSINNYL